MYYDNTFQNIPLFMEQQANDTIFQTAFAISGDDPVPGTGIPLSSWRFGIDPLPTIPAPSHNLTDGSTGRIMDPNYRTPVTEEFNGGYTWAINSKSVFEAEYVHVLGLHENKTINLDPKIPVNPANITTTKVTETAAGVPVCSGPTTLRILPPARCRVHRCRRAGSGQPARRAIDRPLALRWLEHQLPPAQLPQNGPDDQLHTVPFSRL